MNPYRRADDVDPELLLLKPRSRCPLRVAIALMFGFVAFVYYALFEAFGADAVITLPGPLGLLVGAVASARRYNDPRVEAARKVLIEQVAAARLETPDAPWPRISGGSI